MADATVGRRLAAILFADVHGYSRLMGADEAGTLRALQACRFAVVDPTIGQFRGRIIKHMGDGILTEFRSAVDAVGCAIAIQERMVARGDGEDRSIRLRIGINVGEILVVEDDVYGDGVNIAARLEGIAEPDGVAISNAVHAHVADELEERFVDLGAHQLKNIARPVRVFHYSPAATSAMPKPAFRPFVDIPAEEKPLLTGGCLCGAVRYEARDRALGSMLCHCRMCQRFSGAPVLGGTTFLTDAVHFTVGEPKYYRSSKIAERGFCATCGSSLVYRGIIGQWTHWIMLFTSSLDRPEDQPPTYHLGIESAMPWLDIRDDLPRTKCADSPSLVDAYGSVGEEVP